MKTVEIEVTKWDITRARSIIDAGGRYIWNCPIAIASRRILKKKNVSVGSRFIGIESKPGTVIQSIKLPVKAKKFIDVFDSTPELSEPITFNVRVRE